MEVKRSNEALHSSVGHPNKGESSEKTIKYEKREQVNKEKEKIKQPEYLGYYFPNYYNQLNLQVPTKLKFTEPPKYFEKPKVDFKTLSFAVASCSLSLYPDQNGRLKDSSIDWELVSKIMGNFTPEQCKNTWVQQSYYHKLDVKGDKPVMVVCNPNFMSKAKYLVNPESLERSLEYSGKRKRKPMSLEEERTIYKFQKKYGNKWTYIAQKMNTGRSGVEIKNYWHNKQQKLALQLLKAKTSN